LGAVKSSLRARPVPHRRPRYWPVRGPSLAVDVMALRFPSPAALARGALVLAAPLALLLTTGRDLWLRPDYAFAALAAPAALALAARRAWAARPWQPGHPAVGRALAAAAWLVLAAAVLVGAPQGAALALVVGLVAVAWDLGGWPLLRETAPALALLALCIPLPPG